MEICSLVVQIADSNDEAITSLDDRTDGNANERSGPQRSLRLLRDPTESYRLGRRSGPVIITGGWSTSASGPSQGQGCRSRLADSGRPSVDSLQFTLPTATAKAGLSVSHNQGRPRSTGDSASTVGGNDL